MTQLNISLLLVDILFLHSSTKKGKKHTFFFKNGLTTRLANSLNGSVRTNKNLLFYSKVFQLS